MELTRSPRSKDVKKRSFQQLIRMEDSLAISLRKPYMEIIILLRTITYYSRLTAILDIKTPFKRCKCHRILRIHLTPRCKLPPSTKKMKRHTSIVQCLIRAQLSLLKQFKISNQPTCKERLRLTHRINQLTQMTFLVLKVHSQVRQRWTFHSKVSNSQSRLEMI